MTLSVPARRSRCTATLCLLNALPSHAALLRACRPTDTPLMCRLLSLLTLLYAAAAVLALVLVLAVLAAVRAFQRKSPKPTRHEIRPDAE